MEDNFENWKEILLKIFQDNIRIRIDVKGKNKKIYNKNHLTKLSIIEKKLIQILYTLHRYEYLDLKRRSSENSFYFTINKKGIEIALKLQEHEDNNKFQNIQILSNRILLFLSVILAMGAITQIANLLSENFIIKIFIFILFISLIPYGIKKLTKNK